MALDSNATSPTPVYKRVRRRRRFSLRHWLQKSWTSISPRHRKLIFRLFIAIVTSGLAILAALLVVLILS